MNNSLEKFIKTDVRRENLINSTITITEIKAVI